jgi:putative lipoprotein
MTWACRIISVVILVLSAPTARAEDRKIDRWLSSDKFKHYTVSAFYSAATAIVANRHFDIREERSLFIGFGVTMSLGSAKEIKDFHSKGETASFKDLFWDLAGALTGTLAAGLLL